VNSPRTIRFYCDQTLISFRISTSENNTVKFVLYITGGVQAIVPMSMA